MSEILKQAASKRAQVEKASSTVFIAVAFSAVIVMFSLISMRFLWEKKSYNDRIVSAKTKARDQIQNNIESVDKLTAQFPQLDSSASTNSKKILHALPPVYDYAALASSIDSLATISGVKSTTAIGEDTSSSAIASASVSKPIEIPLSLQVNGSYDAIKRYVGNLEKSIRPMQITSLAFTGDSNSLQATIQAVTYYQPARSFDVTKVQIQ